MKWIPFLLIAVILLIRTIIPEAEILYHEESKVIASEKTTEENTEEISSKAVEPKVHIEVRLIFDPVDNVYYSIDVFNTLTSEQLDHLKGIGPKTAELILKRITEVGPFQSFDELLEIKGIGPKKLEQILEQSK